MQLQKTTIEGVEYYQFCHTDYEMGTLETTVGDIFSNPKDIEEHRTELQKIVTSQNTKKHKKTFDKHHKTNTMCILF